jgi:ubiquinone/menaquinone biosynthesis C-methylase UbiE
MAETSKARERRIKEGFYMQYIYEKSVIDIGVGRFDTVDGADPICEWAEMHDKDICDATTMDAYQDEQFDTVYASHILEHLTDPITAIRNWIRICKKGGHVIISVPDRDLYERKTELPSKWNADHKYFYLMDKSFPPHTFSFQNVVETALGKGYIVKFEKIDTVTNKDKPHEHATGEFSLECIITKM